MEFEAREFASNRGGRKTTEAPCQLNQDPPRHRRKYWWRERKGRARIWIHVDSWRVLREPVFDQRRHGQAIARIGNEDRLQMRGIHTAPCGGHPFGRERARSACALLCVVAPVADAVIPDSQAIVLAATVGFASIVLGHVRWIGKATASDVVHRGL